MKQLNAGTLVLIATVLMSSMLTAGSQSTAHATSDPPSMVIGVWSTACSSFNLTLSSCPSASLSVGQTISVQINVTNSLPYDGFETALYYDPSILTVTSLDFHTNTVWSNPFPIINDTKTQPGGVFISLVNLGGTPVLVDGTLANINFKVLATGVSPLTLAAGMAAPSTAAVAIGGTKVDWTRITLVTGSGQNAHPVPAETGTADGYFMNEVGKRGPVSVFSYSPAQPLISRDVSFNATGSYDLDNATYGYGKIRHFLWDFGDGQNGIDSSTVKHVYITPGGNYTARLTVVDSDDTFEGMSVQRIYVAPPPTHDVAVSGVTPSPTAVNAGAKVTITVTLLNKGTYTENYNLTVTWNTPPVQLGFNQSTIAPVQTKQHTYTIDTTGLSAGSYQVTAVVKIPIANVTSDQKGTAIFTVNIINQNPNQILYVLLGVVAVIAVIAVTVVVLRRRRPHEDS